jgi:hypothetical protein
MRAIRLLLPVVFLASPLTAQKAAPRLELGADVSFWQLDRGTASSEPTTRPSGTVRAGVVIPSRLPATLGLSATFASEDGTEPGLLVVSGEYAQRLFPESPDGLNLFVAAGAGILQFSVKEPLLPDCPSLDGCIDESIDYDNERRTVLSGSIGADLGLARGLLAQPVLSVVKPFGGREGSSGRDAMFRLGIGLAWRP